MSERDDGPRFCPLCGFQSAIPRRLEDSGRRARWRLSCQACGRTTEVELEGGFVHDPRTGGRYRRGRRP